jgi:hypothetical protein
MVIDLCNENYKTLKKGIKKIPEDGTASCVHALVESIL